MTQMMMRKLTATTKEGRCSQSAQTRTKTPWMVSHLADVANSANKMWIKVVKIASWHENIQISGSAPWRK